MRKLLATITFPLIVLVAQAESTLELSKHDTVIVLADEAWEEPDAEVIHFRGHFRLSGPDWSVVAEQATLYGSLEAPDRVVVDGSPALIVVQKSLSEGQIEGRSNRIEYSRSEDFVQLSGEAVVSDKGSHVASSVLRWDLAADRIIASGTEGAKMILYPKSDP